MAKTARSKSKFKVKLKQTTINSIGALILFVLAGLTWLSFIRQGSVLIYINDGLTNIFGVVSVIILPFPLLVSGLMLTSLKTSLAKGHVLLGSLLTLVTLIGSLGQGEVGRFLWTALSALLSKPGAGVFFGMGFLISIMITLNIPLEEVFSWLKAFKLPNLKLKGNIKMGGMANMASLTPLKMKIPSSTQVVPVTPNQLPLKTINNSESTKSKESANITPATLKSNTIWHYPPAGLLAASTGSGKADRGDVNNNAQIIEQTLEAFGITAKVVEVNLGPAVTQYALEVAIGTKLSKINALSNDLALALAAPTGQIRIEAPIPGRALVGVELPNKAPEFVGLKKILESDNLKQHKSKLAVALGLDVSGSPVVADIAKMPHVLVAGSTGSGKSVCINVFIASILFRASPEEVKFIMVDPKRVELTGYNGIPHLLSPVIVEPEKVLSALKWATNEMDHRYKMFAEVGARNLDTYNEMSGFQALPNIVIIIDELADVMMYAQVEAEDAITRLAQMARATGIHLVLATQRPSTDVITGLIKANVPTRISFAVSSMIDSRVIIDQPGAEKLLGKGDMLFVPPDQAKPTRIQGAFVSDKEIKGLIDYLKQQGVEPSYTNEVTNMPIARKGSKAFAGSGNNSEAKDELFTQAVQLVIQFNNASSSFLQRKLSVGYARAARIVDELEQAGIVGQADGAKPRDIHIQNAQSYLEGK